MEAKDFDTKQDKPFDEWLIEKRARILELGKLLGQKAPPEAEQGRESWLNTLADRISDNLQEVSELEQTAENYWLKWCAEQTAGLEGNPKSLLDKAKNTDCSQKRVHDFLTKVLKTIDTRASLTQSCLKFYRSVA